jgi:hypothetical protein
LIRFDLENSSGLLPICLVQGFDVHESKRSHFVALNNNVLPACINYVSFRVGSRNKERRRGLECAWILHIPHKELEIGLSGKASIHGKRHLVARNKGVALANHLDCGGQLGLLGEAKDQFSLGRQRVFKS